MKILHVYKDYYPPVKGGIESHINLLCNGLMNRGVDVQVLVSNTYNKFECETCNRIPIAKAPQLGRFFSAPLTPTFSHYLRRFGKDADIIHFHHPNPTAEFSYFFTNLKKKLIVTYHSDIIRQDKLGKLYSPFRKRFLEKADRIIATSPTYIETSNVLKHYKKKCTVIPLGIDSERFCSFNDPDKIEQIKREYGPEPLILFVGCFRYYKGLHLLISATRNVSARLLLIGAGPEEPKLRRLTEKLQLNEKVRFLGELPDDEVNAYYKACDLFVLSSHLRSEAFGIVQLEAMCCRKPVISTELGTGTDFVNINQQTGITVKPNSVASLSRAIRSLIENPQKRTEFGECGYMRVQQAFTAEKMVASTLRLYEQVLNKNWRIENNLPSAIGTNFDSKIKILRVVSRLNIGGPTIHVKNLTENLDPKKFITRLITGTVSPGEGDMTYITNFKDNVHIVIPEMQREISPIHDFSALIKVIKEIKLFDPHIIHSHTSKAGAIARLAAFVCNIFRRKKSIVIHTFHGNVLDGYFSRSKSNLILLIERLLARFSNIIIAISDTQHSELSDIYKIDHEKKISTIKLGFDLSPFVSVQRKNGQVYKRWNIEDDALLVGIIGRMVPIKNHKMFLDAAKMLTETIKNRNITFLLVGDGENRQDLEDYVDHLKIRDRVVFTGWEKDLPSIYADLDILALTSINEGTPVSVIEAMAASVPVVSTGVGGIKDLLGSLEIERPSSESFKICERGILCPKNDPRVFSNALAYTIENGYLLDNTRLAKAREYVLTNYSVERLVRDVESLYEGLLTTTQRANAGLSVASSTAKGRAV